MDYIIKDLTFKKDEEIVYLNHTANTYISEITIHDIVKINITIVEHIPNESYNIRFTSASGYKIFDMSDDEPCSNYTVYGFKTYKESYEYANKEMKRILGNFISCVLADIDDYIEEINNI